MLVTGSGMDVRLASARTRRSPVHRLPLMAVAGLLLLVNLAGLSYYVLSMGERVRHPLHAWFKPSGYVGQTAGILTLLLFLFMYLYPLRKRFRNLVRWGSLARWLDLHIAAGLAIPVVGAMHAGWRFNGLIGIGFLAMLLVSLSGIVGRYIYIHIPHSRSGLEMDLDEIETQRRRLSAQIARTAAVEPREIEAVLGTLDGRAQRGVLATCRDLVAGDFLRWKMIRALRRRWGRTLRLNDRELRGLVQLARRHVKLEQQRRMLDATQRVFRFWHVVHRPFSITALVAVTIHVVVVVSLGVTWFW